MRARPDILPHLIAERMRRWLSIAQCPLVNTKVPIWKARRNYRALVRRYPQIAGRLGYTEAMSYAGPLHDLQRIVAPQQPPLAPQQEFPIRSLNTDVTNPVPARQYAEQVTRSQLEPQASGMPRMIGLEDEVL
jgi:hypothetical protein